MMTFFDAQFLHEYMWGDVSDGGTLESELEFENVTKEGLVKTSF
jgi:hypothetical protein